MATAIGILFWIAVILAGYWLWKRSSLAPVGIRSPSVGTSINVDAWLQAISSGSLPPINPDGIVPVPGETFFYQQVAQYGQTFKQRVYGGGNRALYIPLGHGFRYRVGGNAGAAQNVENFMWVGYGTVYVSNVRVVFKRNDTVDVAIAPYNETLAYECYPDGLALQVGRVGPMQFRTGDPVLGTLFRQVITGNLRARAGSGTT